MKMGCNSLEDAAKVASDNWLILLGRLFVAGGTLVAFGVILIVIAGLISAFLVLMIRQSILQAFYSLQ
jgi:hypothetical protein